MKESEPKTTSASSLSKAEIDELSLLMDFVDSELESNYLKDLSHPTKIFFNYRCLQRVLPLFHHYFPNAPKTIRQEFEDCISIAKECAHGQTSTVLKNMIQEEVYSIVKEKAIELTNYSESVKNKPNIDQQLENIIILAVTVLKSIIPNKDAALEFTSACFSMNVSIYLKFKAMNYSPDERTPYLYDSLVNDLTILKKYSLAHTSEFVPENLLGALWVRGVPKNWL